MLQNMLAWILRISHAYFGEKQVKLRLNISVACWKSSKEIVDPVVYQGVLTIHNSKRSGSHRSVCYYEMPFWRKTYKPIFLLSSHHM